MPKSDIYGGSLVPAVLIAGILSGTLFRGAPAGDTAKASDAASTAEKTADVTDRSQPWISDLRPAMLAVADALGTGADEATIAGIDDVSFAAAPADLHRQILDQMSALRSSLNDRLGGSACRPKSASAELDAVRVLSASLLLASADATKSLTPAINALLEEYRDWQLLERLVNRATAARSGTSRADDVKFVVATVPDYVDSNIGWQADQNLAGIQSGMTREEYVFDRIRLIDWSRNAGGSSGPSSGSRLHERQPGAVIFRKTQDTIDTQVVLLVLETPTAGVHRTSLRNSLSFLKAWNSCLGQSPRPLRVLGPTFSGSIVSLATVLSEYQDAFSTRLVITGSANADSNREQMKVFSGGAGYYATVQPSLQLKQQMAAVLSSMNAEWKDGQKVALLTESNTVYGQSTQEAVRCPAAGAEPLSCAAVFRFPLHISQLRGDSASSSPPNASLLPAAMIPLNLREPVPPSDLIPALRPQMTSPVVQATVDSIFDAIRHERFTAVGIFATDDRDTLFLAREVKRAAPDVQLFLFGAHAIYLHPDYVPYLRGSLVASPYSLSLANQPETGGGSRDKGREPYQSMSAEGISYAMQAILQQSATNRPDAALDYCRENGATPCVPVSPASISVIGEDGYWPLPSPTASSDVTPAPATVIEGEISGGKEMPPPGKRNIYPLPPLPIRVIIGAGFIGLFVVAHLVLMLRVRKAQRMSDDGALDAARFLELPLVSILSPPLENTAAIGYHRLALRIVVMLLALLAGWTAAIAVPFLAPAALVPAAAVAILASVVGAASIALRQEAVAKGDQKTAAREAWFTRLRRVLRQVATWLRGTPVIGLLLLLGLLATLGLFAGVIVQLLQNGADAEAASLVLARVVGGGIVSPASLTLSLIAAIYTALFVGLRRLSLIGKGYGALSRNSSTFRLLTNARSQADASEFGAMLDMPAQHLPAIYLNAILLAIIIAAIGTWHLSTLDGWVFSWFVRIGSLTVLGLGLMQLAQGLGTWNATKWHLRHLAQSRLGPVFHRIAQHGSWDISLSPPGVADLIPVARIADGIAHDLRTLKPPAHYARVKWGRRQLTDLSPLRLEGERRTDVRDAALVDRAPLFKPPPHLKALHVEIAERPGASLIQSESWFTSWQFTDQVVTLLQDTYWQRAKSGSSQTLPAHTGENTETAPNPAERDDWFMRCERLVTLQIAFVLRDVVVRTITSLFAALLCLTLLTASHLFYTFNGRTAMLTIDLLAVAGASLSAVWILIGMERDTVLSSLRRSTPGRVDMSWDFMKRIAVYGVLPLIAVIASVFPEIGGTLFGWLEPLRKLSSF